MEFLRKQQKTSVVNKYPKIFIETLYEFKLKKILRTLVNRNNRSAFAFI